MQTKIDGGNDHVCKDDFALLGKLPCALLRVLVGILGLPQWRGRRSRLYHDVCPLFGMMSWEKKHQ